MLFPSVRRKGIFFSERTFTMEKWVVSAKRADFQAIAEKFGIDQVTARLIRNRDIVGEPEIRQYLYGTKEDFYDPHLLKDADKLVEILMSKIKEQKKIRIIGDYDIDGVNASYILLRGLEKLKQEEQEQQAAVNITKVWLNNFSRRKLTIKQLTREVLVELIDKIYVYPDQKIDIYFKFASEKNSVDVTVQKDGVI